MTQIEKMIEFAEERNRVFFENGEESVFEANCDILENMLDNCDLHIKPHDRFFVRVNVAGLYGKILNERIEKFDGLLEKHGLDVGARAMAYSGSFDFGHTAAGWESIISLGIYGIKKRIDEYRQSCNDPLKIRFYDGVGRVYAAALRFMERAAHFAADNRLDEMSEGLMNLTRRSPKTLYEAMQTSLVFYSLNRYFDRSDPRTMGRIDSLFYPYFADCDREFARGLIDDYLASMNRFNTPANIPFALGGVDGNGNSAINELSYLILEEYRKLRPVEVKIHILVSEGMPRKFLAEAMESIREGSNSIVFISDSMAKEALVNIGEKAEDAARYNVVGCYECGGYEELACTCNARVNVPKALEYALNGGVDVITGESVGLPNDGMPDSFEALTVEFYRQLEHLCQCAMRSTDLWEERVKMIHAAPILSPTYLSALESAGDLYCNNGARYNNSSVNAMGLATAADSLYAIKRLVFEEKRYSLSELNGILRSDWSKNEALRLYCKNKIAKFGNCNGEVDAIAADIVRALSDNISGKPNVKGGVYRLGLFSIDQRWSLGAKTAASADGRRAGETLSQNTGATFGADRDGATSHILSVTSLDFSRVPNGAVIDIDLHSSAVEGENGLAALLATLYAYIFDGQGFAIHYNVLNTDVLRDAVENPDKYPNLQVRLCGWNVLFSSLKDCEKEEFIRRSLNR